MSEKKANVERLGAFSDGVFAVLITIMVLELKPPSVPTFTALLPLWPTAISYAVSYLFIAIVWTNHHHLLGLHEESSTALIWTNFAHLFAVSLVPFATAWVAETHLAAVPVFLYAAVFVLVESAYLQFEHHTLSRAAVDHLSPDARRVARLRSWIAFGSFVSAMFASLAFPKLGFALVFCAVLLYLKPKPDARNGTARIGAASSGDDV